MVAFVPSGSNERIPRGAPGLAFAVLGPVRAWRDGTELDLGSPQQRLTLAVLLLARGRMVPIAELVAALWADQEPSSARGTVRTYVHRLRRAFGGDEETGGPLRSAGNGYRLRIDERSLDLGRFRAARQTADQARTSGDARAAGTLLRQAMDEWQGEALAGLPGEWAASERRRLHHLGFQTAESLAGLELEHERGDRADLVERLVALARAEPLRESVHELLMLALYRSGRAAEALAAFEKIRVALRDELGVDPCPALRDLHERILRSDDDLLPSPPRAPVTAPPAQLPAALPVFCGRRTELDELTTRLDTDPAPGVVVVHGTAGVGKTTFAVHWASLAAPSFPDGQLYVNLRGFEAGGVARPPEDVLGDLLDALGAPVADRPTGLDALTALYRSVLASRRVLILLDNARSDAQVLPLLPGGTRSLTLVTSRLELTGVVVAAGAHAMKLGLFDDEQSADLMALRLGRRRIAAEPEAVREIAAACARLPLALAVVCARIACDPGRTLSDTAQELVECRLDAFGSSDPNADLRSLLSWSYLAVTPPAARLFRLLSVMPGADFTLEAAASAAGLPMRQAFAAMGELTRADLINSQHGRYSSHDLLRDYAGELLAETETAAEIRAAHRRLLDHHVVLAHTATEAMDPNNEDQPPPMEIAPGVQPGPALDDQAALTMFIVEHPTFLALIRHADELGFDRHTWYLAWYLRRFLDWTGRIEVLAACNEIAFRAAHRAGDQRGIGYVHRGLARVAWWREDIPACHRNLDQAIEAFASAGDRVAQAYTHRQVAGVMIDPGRHAGQYDAAFEQIERARALLREEGRLDLECSLLSPVARCLWHAGRTEEAVEAAEISRRRNEELGRKADLLDSLDVLAFAHAKLGDHRTAIAFKEERIALIGRNDESADPGFTATLREQLAFEMVELIGMLLAAGDHARAQVTQREVLVRLRHELTDPGFTTDPGASDDLGAVLADLDALIGRDDLDPGWYTASEAILRRVSEIADRAGAVRWMARLFPHGVLTP
ncbi:BTAD domain-containing putative transcriptional regulator [Lentzea sp. BCCO 10_0061]|uniref:BTAD domain-containing putative transcriptional regulator n=1 Tax=Lentzea sokolovensis TaxID=3095429 RepID=A0ABU4VDL8_9PSEU|nr:BTAD domain-containing putative transcriptional regulator [Lentzea sp. BCCO 10_0061]MDX8149492.1 BTAD domain-containing putative transcriptional regulator [Lentzea sp. BCCO 10_0061]